MLRAQVVVLHISQAVVMAVAVQLFHHIVEAVAEHSIVVVQ